MNTLESALEYAARGWRVIPVNGKLPLITEWQKKATCNPKTIEGWWKQWPNANVGIATGKESGIFVIDVDLYKPGALQAYIDLFKKNEESFDHALTAISGGDGLHFYFAYPATGKVTSRNEFKTGIDRKGDGGFIVAPPSLHATGRRYRWSEYRP